MPAPKNLMDMLADLQSADKDGERQCEILDAFQASSDVTLDFVVNVGGKVVKALRGSADEAVRKRAIALTAHWKKLVKGKLDNTGRGKVMGKDKGVCKHTMKMVMKKEQDSNDEAGKKRRHKSKCMHAFIHTGIHTGMHAIHAYIHSLCTLTQKRIKRHACSSCMIECFRQSMHTC